MKDDEMELVNGVTKKAQSSGSVICWLLAIAAIAFAAIQLFKWNPIYEYFRQTDQAIEQARVIEEQIKGLGE